MFQDQHQSHCRLRGMGTRYITLNSLTLAYCFSLSRTFLVALKDHDSMAFTRTLTPQEISHCIVLRGQQMCDFFLVSETYVPSLNGSSLLSEWNKSCFTPLGQSRLFHTDCSRNEWGGYIHPSTLVLTAVAMRVPLG